MGRVGRDEKDAKTALKLYEDRKSNGLSVNDIVQMTGVPRSTIYAKAKNLKYLELLHINLDIKKSQ